MHVMLDRGRTCIQYRITRYVFSHSGMTKVSGFVKAHYQQRAPSEGSYPLPPMSFPPTSRGGYHDQSIGHEDSEPGNYASQYQASPASTSYTNAPLPSQQEYGISTPSRRQTTTLDRWSSPSPAPVEPDRRQTYPVPSTSIRLAPYHPAAMTRPPSSAGPSRHECTICGKRFSRPSGLKIHVTTHTGEKRMSSLCRCPCHPYSLLLQHISVQKKAVAVHSACKATCAAIYASYTKWQAKM